MKVVGMISGTSADGIDAALCEITGAPPALEARILHAITHPYPDGLQTRVLDASQPGRAGADELCALNAALGEQFARAALAVIAGAGRTPDQIDLIGSHGQTVWHQVEPDGSVSATLQLTEAAVIAERTGITTVANFRPRDIAAGGQGAPLTSYADWLLLRAPRRWRAVQNIGGIGNVTFLPPLDDTLSAPLAFDTGPGNALMDSTVTLITHGAQHYDRDGALAAQGTVDVAWLAELMQHPYYERRPPKTTGRELFSAEMAADLLAEGYTRGLDDASILATLATLTAASIADAYRRFAPAEIGEVILGGGGARNPLLVGLLRERLAPAAVLRHEDLGLDSDNKEALVFALLAHETWHNRPGTHPVLTGARHASVLGQIVPGANFASLLRRTWCDA
ncbi:MAG: anhydro-N-acetylmuramic acid kinase [Anaerolineae bacterium]|nr:anhydro-N-acetylmuramic acid kinase [Anaerolineae bacterium]